MCITQNLKYLKKLKKIAQYISLSIPWYVESLFFENKDYFILLYFQNNLYLYINIYYNENVYYSKFKISQEIEKVCAIYLSVDTLVGRVTFFDN